jgi:YVTN family beta-propeller protein
MWIAGIAATLLVAAGVVAVVLAVTGEESAGIVPPPDSVAVIDPETNDIVAAIPVGIRPGPIAAGNGFVWVGSLHDRSLTKIDMRRHARSGTVPLEGRTPTGLAVDRGRVWVAHGLLGSITVVDGQFDNILETIPVTDRGTYSAKGSVTSGAAAVWAAFGDGTLARLDPERLRVVRTTTTDGSPAGVAEGYGSVWVASTGQSTVQRFTVLTMAEIDSVGVSRSPAGIVAGFGDVWVTSMGADAVQRVDIGGGSIDETTPVADGPGAIAVGSGAVWVASAEAGVVSRIDPETNDVVAEIDVGQRPAGLAVAGGFVWVTLQEP